MRKLEHGNSESEFITIPQTADNLNTSEVTARNLAKKYGTLVKIGRSSRVNWSKLRSAIMNDCTVEK